MMDDPKIVDMPKKYLVGIVGTGESVLDLDIAGLWARFIEHENEIKRKIEGVGYELHIEEETEPTMHFCLVGVAVEKIKKLPLELFAKVIPAGEYAVFTHQFSEGDFGEAFKAVYAWIDTSEYQPAFAFDIQCYDERYKGPADPASVIEIMVPVKPK